MPICESSCQLYVRLRSPKGCARSIPADATCTENRVRVPQEEPHRDMDDRQHRRHGEESQMTRRVNVGPEGHAILSCEDSAVSDTGGRRRLHTEGHSTEPAAAERTQGRMHHSETGLSEPCRGATGRRERSERRNSSIFERRRKVTQREFLGHRTRKRVLSAHTHTQDRASALARCSWYKRSEEAAGRELFTGRH